jgi:hypothetical protein
MGTTAACVRASREPGGGVGWGSMRTTCWGFMRTLLLLATAARATQIGQASHSPVGAARRRRHGKEISLRGGSTGTGGDGSGLGGGESGCGVCATRGVAG